MGNVTNLLASAVNAPSGMWASILNWIEGAIVNYGWVIILFTLLVKACLSPLDLLVKFSTKKQTLVQQKCAPQVARINKKYANDKNAAQMQTNALYKKEGFNAITSCLVMIVNLALTMVVFFTLFASLREMSAYKAIMQYDAIQTSYINALTPEATNKFKASLADPITVYVVTNTKDDNGNITSQTLTSTLENQTYDNFKAQFEGTGEGDEKVVGIFENMFNVKSSLTDEQKTFLESHYTYYNETDNKYTNSLYNLLTSAIQNSQATATEAANEKWGEVKESWLWVSNIWVADNYKSPLPSYKDLASMAKNSKNKAYISYVNNIDKSLYNTITSSIHSKVNRWNGYFILSILAGVTAFLSQFITEKMSKSKNKSINQYVDQANPMAGKTGMFMKILLPALMVIFTLTSSAAFSIYIVASQIISIGISALTGVIVNACFKKKEAEITAQLEREALKSMKKNKR